MFEQALPYWRANHDLFLEGLKSFLRIPSISTDPKNAPEVLRSAELVANELRAMGMSKVELINGEPGEHPLVYAEWLGAPGKPTILAYGHDDVQPVDPLNEWVSPPFEPQIRNGKIYARGSSDDKGQVYILLKALEGYLKTTNNLPVTPGKLPVNVKVLIESEEESSGTHVKRFVEKNKKRLAADAVLLLDSGMYAPGMPTITTGLRGLVCAEILCQGGQGDLHSGNFGGVAPNAAIELAKIIAAITTPSGRVRIPGFYDGIIKPSKLELEAWAKLPFDEDDFRGNSVGAYALTGDTRYSVNHRIFARPTFELNGITGGFTGDGFKTVIPAHASAKVSMRLVPGMDPKRIADLFSNFVKKITPDCVSTEVIIISQDPALVADTGNRFVQAAAQAQSDVFQAPTVYVRRGGSIPVATTFQTELEAPVVLTGFTLPDCNMHAPNESLDLGNFYKGIEAVGRYLYLLSE